MAAIPMVFLGQAKEALDDIMAQLPAGPPDAVITGELELAGRLAAWKLKLPLLMVFTSYAPCPGFSMLAGTAELFQRLLGGDGQRDFRRCGLLPEALPVRALRPVPDDGHAVWHRAHRPRDRRSEGLGAALQRLRRRGGRVLFLRLSGKGPVSGHPQRLQGLFRRQGDFLPAAPEVLFWARSVQQYNRMYMEIAPAEIGEPVPFDEAFAQLKAAYEAVGAENLRNRPEEFTRGGVAWRGLR